MDITRDDIKLFMRALVAQTNKHKSAFKYLTFESGIKMLANANVQFTRGDALNDNEDCNICKCDMSKPIMILKSLGIADAIINREIQKKRDEISRFGICSFGTRANNDILWKRYASEDNIREDGVCIELNLKTVIDDFFNSNEKITALLVRYVADVKQIIPWDLFTGSPEDRILFAYLLFSTKNKMQWSDEEELRLIWPNMLDDRYLRCSIDKKCFKAVYYGRDMSIKQRKELGIVLNRKFPRIKRVFR